MVQSLGPAYNNCRKSEDILSQPQEQWLLASWRERVECTRAVHSHQNRLGRDYFTAQQLSTIDPFTSPTEPPPLRRSRRLQGQAPEPLSLLFTPPQRHRANTFYRLLAGGLDLVHSVLPTRISSPDLMDEPTDIQQASPTHDSPVGGDGFSFHTPVQDVEGGSPTLIIQPTHSLNGGVMDAVTAAHPISVLSMREEPSTSIVAPSAEAGSTQTGTHTTVGATEGAPPGLGQTSTQSPGFNTGTVHASGSGGPLVAAPTAFPPFDMAMFMQAMERMGQSMTDKFTCGLSNMGDNLTTNIATLRSDMGSGMSALGGRVSDLGDKMERTNEVTHQRIDRVVDAVNRRFDQVDSRYTALEARMETSAQQFDDLQRKFFELQEQVRHPPSPPHSAHTTVPAAAAAAAAPISLTPTPAPLVSPTPIEVLPSAPIAPSPLLTAPPLLNPNIPAAAAHPSTPPIPPS